MDSIKATAYYAVLNVPASILFSFAVALMLSSNIKGRGVFRSIFYLPSIIPAVASCMVWVWLLNQQYGLINTVLKSVGITPPAWIWSKDTVIPTLVMINMWNTGGTMVIFLAGIMSVPKVYYEALEIDGGNAFHKLIYVTIPMVTPDPVLQHHHGDHQLPAGVHTGLHHDRGRTEQRIALLLPVHLSRGVPEREHGLCLRAGVAAVPDHTGAYDGRAQEQRHWVYYSDGGR